MPPIVPQVDARPLGPGPPRFTLRTLLIVVTAVGCLFGVMTALGTVWSLGILMILCLVFAHVAGNSLGTHLRDQATRHAAAEQNDRLANPSPDRPAERRPPVPLEAMTPSQLTRRGRLNRATPIMTIGAAIAGGALGARLSAFVYPEAGLAAVGLGLVSAAVLGALVGFAACSFISVARAAWGEALGNGEQAVGHLSKHPPH